MLGIVTIIALYNKEYYTTMVDSDCFEIIL